MKTRYGLSPWIDSFPDTRRPSFEPFRGHKTTDVVIVGGGLTGCATAQALAAAGRKPLLLEAARIGEGSGGRSTGLLLSEPGVPFRDLVQHHGLRATRIVLDAWRKAAVDGAAVLRRAGVRCDAMPVESLVAASYETERQLRRDLDARQAAGVEGAWLDARKLQQLARVDAAGGVRGRGGHALDPYKACTGLARAAIRNRARIYEKSPVEKVEFSAKDVRVTLRSGTITASLVIVATGAATTLFTPLRRHFQRRERYAVLTEAVPAPIRKQLFADDLVLRVERASALQLRWTADKRLVVSGADQDETAAARRQQVLVQRTGQLMYELLTTYPVISGLRPEFGWDVAYGDTTDGLPYIGAHRNYPRHLFALGGNGHSVTDAFVAARLLTRAVLESSEKTDQVFGWTR
jgi:glycine/D-amino acid oxidase-like deaminating enzyme